MEWDERALTSLYAEDLLQFALCLKEGEDINKPVGNMMKKPLLFHAIELNMPEFVSMLLEAGAKQSGQIRGRKSPLHIACLDGYSEIVKMLINHKADLHPRDAYGRTPLHIAYAYKHLECVQHLLEAKASNRIKDIRNKLASDLAPKEWNKNMFYKHLDI